MRESIFFGLRKESRKICSIQRFKTSRKGQNIDLASELSFEVEKSLNARIFQDNRVP